MRGVGDFIKSGGFFVNIPQFRDDNCDFSDTLFYFGDSGNLSQGDVLSTFNKIFDTNYTKFIFINDENHEIDGKKPWLRLINNLHKLS